MIYGNPKIDPDARIAREAVILGDVAIGAGISVWYFSVIRGDEDSITIGRGTNIQENSTVHVTTGCPAVIGDGVTVGHNAVLHSCTVGDGSLIGMGSVVLDQASIGKDCLIAAGSLVTKGMQIPDGSMVMGSPARVKRQLTEEEKEDMRNNAQVYLEISKDMKGERGCYIPR